MSTAARTSRTLRSASRAGSRAGSETPSNPPRSTRSRRSNRGSPAPALAPTGSAPADDADEIPFNLQSYGTTGRTAEIQLQSELIGKRQAVDPIVNAVTDAEAGNSQVNPNLGGLAAVPEGEETAEEETAFNAPEEIGQNQLPHIVEPTEASFFSRLSHSLWSPRDPDHGLEDHPDLVVEHNFLASKWFKYLMLMLVTTAFGFVGYNIPYIVTHVSDLTTYLPTLAGNSDLGTVTAHDYKQLKHRLEKVEHYLHNLHTDPSPSDPSTEYQVINWFTPGFGPIIDAQLSSPTHTYCNPTWKPWPFRLMFWQKCPELPTSPPHRMALQSWDDPVEDRWCAPKSGGKLQLAIEIARPILPTEFVVEYMAKQTSPDTWMTMAPKELELWIRIENEDVRRKVNHAIDAWHPELWDHSSPQGKELHDVRALNEEYVPVGRWIYNIYDKQNVQGFKLLTPLLEFGVQTNKFVIRVNSNWGNMEYTCINRFRMHGVDTSGFQDYLEEDPALAQK